MMNLIVSLTLFGIFALGYLAGSATTHYFNKRRVRAFLLKVVAKGRKGRVSAWDVSKLSRQFRITQ